MSGIGRQLFEDEGLVGWDFDDCFDPETNTITDPSIAAMIAELDSYTEVTPSRTGLRVWTKGAIAKAYVDHSQGIEAYAGGRYLTITGYHLAGTPRSINERQAQTDLLITRLFPEKPKPIVTGFHHETPTLTVDEETILRRARLTTNFRSWETPTESEDRSAVDQSFCNALVSAGATEQQIDDIFRKSRRMRDKWDKVHHKDGRTYGKGTIDTAFDGSIENRYNRPILVVHGQSIDELSGRSPEGKTESPELEHWKSRALAAEAKVDHLELEIAELRLDNTTLINLTTNPSLKAEAPTLIRTAIAVRDAKRRGEADEDGFVQIRTTKISEDYEKPLDGIDPICSRSTVGRHLKKADNLGLIQREVRSVMAPRVVRDENNQPVIDPTTKKPKTFEARTDQTWVKMTGESLTDLLRPFAFFRAPEPTDTINPPKTEKHGGDRRSEKARAAMIARRTACPDCGSTERKTYCTGCGSDITEIANAEEERANEAARVAQTIPASPGFQDAPLYKRGLDTAFHLETPLGQSDQVNTPIASAWMNAEPLVPTQIDPGVPF